MPNKVVKFVNEVKIELTKVSWSSRSELIHSTIVVIVAMILLALFIGVCDFVLSKVIGFVLKF